jgi:hypothetical protein
MKSIVMWPVLLMALAWQCWAIEISPDTVFTSSNFMGDTGAQFSIKNVSAVDTVFIDTSLLLLCFA